MRFSLRPSTWLNTKKNKEEESKTIDKTKESIYLLLGITQYHAQIKTSIGKLYDTYLGNGVSSEHQRSVFDFQVQILKNHWKTHHRGTPMPKDMLSMIESWSEELQDKK